MAQDIMLTVLIACSLLTAAIAAVGEKPSMDGVAVKEVKAMSEKDQTALALSAAPGHIAKEASIMIYGDLPPFITPELRKLTPVSDGPRLDSW